MPTETYAQWIQRVNRQWITDERTRKIRHGQWLWVCLPAEKVGRIPVAFDPYYDDGNVENFLLYVERVW